MVPEWDQGGSGLTQNQPPEEKGAKSLDLATLIRARRSAHSEQPDSTNDPSEAAHVLANLPNQTVADLEVKLVDYLSDNLFSNETGRLAPEGDVMEDAVHYAVRNSHQICPSFKKIHMRLLKSLLQISGLTDRQRRDLSELVEKMLVSGVKATPDTVVVAPTRSSQPCIDARTELSRRGEEDDIICTFADSSPVQLNTLHSPAKVRSLTNYLYLDTISKVTNSIQSTFVEAFRSISLFFSTCFDHLVSKTTYQPDSFPLHALAPLDDSLSQLREREMKDKVHKLAKMLGLNPDLKHQLKTIRSNSPIPSPSVNDSSLRSKRSLSECNMYREELDVSLCKSIKLGLFDYVLYDVDCDWTQTASGGFLINGRAFAKETVYKMLASIFLRFRNAGLKLPPGIKRKTLDGYVIKLQPEFYDQGVESYVTTSHLSDVHEIVANRILMLQAYLAALDPVPFLTFLDSDEVNELQFRQVLVPDKRVNFVEEALNFYRVIYVSPPRLSFFGQKIMFISASSLDTTLRHIRLNQMMYEDNPFSNDTMEFFTEQLLEFHCNFFTLCDTLFTDHTFDYDRRMLSPVEFYLKFSKLHYTMIPQGSFAREVKAAINAATYQLTLLTLWDAKLCTMVDEYCDEEVVLNNEMRKRGLPERFVEENPLCKDYYNFTFSERDALAYLANTDFFRRSCYNFNNYGSEVVDLDVEVAESSLPETLEEMYAMHDPNNYTYGNGNEVSLSYDGHHELHKRGIFTGFMSRVFRVRFSTSFAAKSTQTSLSNLSRSSKMNSIFQRVPRPKFPLRFRRRFERLTSRIRVSRKTFRRCRRSGRGCGTPPKSPKKTPPASATESVSNFGRTTPSLVDGNAQFLNSRTVPGEGASALRRLSDTTSQSLAVAAEASRFSPPQLSATARYYSGMEQTGSRLTNAIRELFPGRRTLSRRPSDSIARPESMNTYGPGSNFVGEELADSMARLSKSGSSNSLHSTPRNIFSKPDSAFKRTFKSFNKDVKNSDTLKQRRRTRKKSQKPPEREPPEGSPIDDMEAEMKRMNAESKDDILQPTPTVSSDPIPIPKNLHSSVGASREYQSLTSQRPNWNTDPFAAARARPSSAWPNDDWAGLSSRLSEMVALRSNIAITILPETVSPT